jgi:hypothetical protein
MRLNLMAGRASLAPPGRVYWGVRFPEPCATLAPALTKASRGRVIWAHFISALRVFGLLGSLFRIDFVFGPRQAREPLDDADPESVSATRTSSVDLAAPDVEDSHDGNDSIAAS